MERSAAPEEIRLAYRRLARAHHPDAHGPESARRMADVNESWQVLSDPGHRALYDASLRPSRMPAVSVAGRDLDGEDLDHEDLDGEDLDDEDLDDDSGFVPMRHPLARLGVPMPWILVVVVLALIFVFTAYAVRPSPSIRRPDGVLEVGSCVTVAPGGVTETACDGAHDGLVIAVPPAGSACDQGATGLLDQRSSRVVCVRQ